MSDAQQAPVMKSDPQITADDVIDYLKDNPDFLAKNPDVIDILVPEKDRSNGRKVADFRYYLVEKARSDKEKLQAQTETIVENVRSNMNNQARIHAATLKLLEAHSFEEFIQVLTMDLAAMLGTDIVTLVVESNGHDLEYLHTSGIRIVAPGMVSAVMKDSDSVLADNIFGDEDLFGGGSGLVKSQALLRIDVSLSTPPALLAFGSRDPDMFKEGQGTEQITYLARVVERCFRNWLALPLK